MVTLQNHVGKISFSANFFTELIGNTVTNCFGVIAMNVRGFRETLSAALPKPKNRDFARGVKVDFKDGALTIDLHISLMYGVNINAVSKSIINKVTYTVRRATGLNVEKVNVFVDAIRV